MKKYLIYICLLSLLAAVLPGCRAAGKPDDSEISQLPQQESSTDISSNSVSDSQEMQEKSEKVIKPGTAVIQYPGVGSMCLDTAYNSAKGDGERYSLELKDTYPDEELDNGQWLFEAGFPDVRFNSPEGYYITTDRYYILRQDLNSDGLVDRLEISDTEWEAVASLDFSQFTDTSGNGDDFTKESVLWAQENADGSILYVSVAHMTYSLSMSDTAYIIAIDMNDKKVLWKSQSCVANAYNFYIKGDTIFGGYGFTDEPDYVYALDARTGETIESYSVATSPDYIFERENKLFVKCYDCVYVYDIK